MYEEWERALPSATDIASLLIWLRERKPQRSSGWDLIARRGPDLQWKPMQPRPTVPLATVVGSS